MYTVHVQCASPPRMFNEAYLISSKKNLLLKFHIKYMFYIKSNIQNSPCSSVEWFSSLRPWDTGGSTSSTPSFHIHCLSKPKQYRWGKMKTILYGAHWQQQGLGGKPNLIQELLKDWKFVWSQMSISKVEGHLRIFAQIGVSSALRWTSTKNLKLIWDQMKLYLEVNLV